MEQIDAKRIAGLLNNYPVTGQFKISEKISSGVMTNFHTFTNNRYCEGAFLVEVDGRDSLWIVIVDAKSSGSYYVMLYPKARTVSIAEIHDQRGATLHWTYSAKKRDGKNPQRQDYFAEVFLSKDVIISIPSRIDQVDDLLSELISLAECCLKAADLDVNKPIARDGFPEGKLKERLHQIRERNPKLVKIAKEEAERREGCLNCACCKFDFHQTYGELGKGFIEAHHTLPLSELHEDGEETRVQDLVLVCANCHRMLHRRRPWLGLSQIKSLLNSY